MSDDPRGGRRETDQRRVILAFDQAVDQLAEDSDFLALERDAQAARYLADAHRALDEVRMSMHRIDAHTADPMLTARARRRLRALSATIAEAGLRDAEHVAAAVRLLRARSDASSRPAGWGETLRVRTARATAWGIEKWTGSPLASTELRSTKVASDQLASLTPILERGRVATPRQLRVRRYALATAASGTVALAAYGAWTLVGQLFGLG
jgi:hypothetical protein